MQSYNNPATITVFVELQCHVQNVLCFINYPVQQYNTLQLQTCLINNSLTQTQLNFAF